MSEEKVIKAIDESEIEQSDLIELSTGVILKGQKANPLIMIRVMSAHPRPKPPTWKDPKMGREMENYDDPDYQDRLKAHEMEQSNAILNAFILLGTSLESLPKKFDGPHPVKKKGELVWPDWIEEYELLNVPMHTESKSWRYLTWVMFRAVADEKDLERIQEVVGRLSGMSEKSVQAAEEFPGSD